MTTPRVDAGAHAGTHLAETGAEMGRCPPEPGNATRAQAASRSYGGGGRRCFSRCVEAASPAAAAASDLGLQNALSPAGLCCYVLEALTVSADAKDEERGARPGVRARARFAHWGLAGPDRPCPTARSSGRLFGRRFSSLGL